MNDATRIAQQLRQAVGEGVRLFDGVPEDATARRPAPGKWCAREVIGHLIDSACNNHRRFVINQSTDTLVMDGYEQNEWVSRQRYHDAPASELVPLWAQYNRRIAGVIEAIADDVLRRPRGPMAGHRFSYFDVPKTEFATLGYVAEDYVGHVRHHLRQIQSLLAR
jgi:hypothetical protein